MFQIFGIAHPPHSISECSSFLRRCPDGQTDTENRFSVLKPVFPPESVVLLGAPELKIHLKDLAETLLGLGLLEPRCEAVEGELRERLSVFRI
jgi:hypothetical protein